MAQSGSVAVRARNFAQSTAGQTPYGDLTDSFVF